MDKQKYIIIDGGFGTTCEEFGADIKNELWSASLLFENPDLIERVHYEFMNHGADVIVTSTY